VSPRASQEESQSRVGDDADNVRAILLDTAYALFTDQKEVNDTTLRTLTEQVCKLMKNKQYREADEVYREFRDECKRLVK
jgi:hypothetical protein